MCQNKKGFLSRDAIKYLAMFAMLLNHIANVFLTPQTFLYELFVDIGYFTAITMCYFLVEGYDYTHSKKAYALRLFWFGVISELPYCLAFTGDGVLGFCGLNMIFTLLICFGIVHSMRQMEDTAYRRILILCLILLTAVCDWGILAPVFTVLFVQAKGSKEKERRAWCVSVCLFLLFELLDGMEQFALGKNLLYSLRAGMGLVLAGICINFFYNGKRMEKGKAFSKWFFYIFYPAHLLVLGLLRIFL